MKILGSLPHEITLKTGELLTLRTGKNVQEFKADAKAQGLKYRIVNVLNPNLRGKTDLHRQPYQPHQYILIQKN